MRSFCHDDDQQDVGVGMTSCTCVPEAPAVLLGVFISVLLRLGLFFLCGPKLYVPDKLRGLSPLQRTIPAELPLLAPKLVPTFADRGCRLVSATSFLDPNRYYFFQVAPQLYSRGWMDPVPDPLLLRKSGSLCPWHKCICYLFGFQWVELILMIIKIKCFT
jgi:hypothetical protein